MQIETADWSGDGDFTEALVAALRTMPEVAFLRVADSPASRAEQGYAFLSNEVFVGFASRDEVEVTRWMGWLPLRRTRVVPALGLKDLEARLSGLDHIGPPDYADEGMLQYLKTQRIVAPYQTRGVKLVEMVRLYPLATPGPALP
ncbi:MAG: hypothetical protein KJ066_00365 [Acidobacteria bacterium]|nr:hypothetical protein [Acidobacteriota bacterium]